MDHEPKKVLIVHQQVLANSLRDVILEASKDKSLERVDVASWFMMSKMCIRDSSMSYQRGSSCVLYVELQPDASCITTRPPSS